MYFKYISLFLFLIVASYGEAKYYGKLFKGLEEKPCSSIDRIDGVYVINLDKRPEKWHHIEPHLYFHGIDHLRFSAICGYELSDVEKKEFCSQYLYEGQLGCMLSHLSVYQSALKQGCEIIWVMEDDAKICRDPHVLTKIIEELEKIDPNWDVLYTDLNSRNRNGKVVLSLGFPTGKKPPFPEHPLSYYTYRKKISKNLQLIRSRYGTYSMLLSQNGMKKILEHFTNYEDAMWAFDIEIHYVPGIKQYGIIDPVGTINYNINISDTLQSNFNEQYSVD